MYVGTSLVRMQLPTSVSQLFYWNSYNVAQQASRFSICCQKANTGGCWPPLDRFIN